jgi:hypothetical protein
MNDIDEQYRRASAQDPSQPSESTRRNILAHAAKLAAQRTANNDPVRADFRRPAANQPSWRPALIGTLAAAGLAGLLITPLFLPPQAPPMGESSNPPAGKEQTAYTAQSARALPPARSAPNASPAPAAKLLEIAPPTQRNVAAQKSHSADGAGAADSSRLESGAPANYTAAQAPAAPLSTASSSAAPPVAAAARMAGAPRAVNTAAALQQAAETGDLPRLQALLAAPVDVDARDAHGRTALMLAALRGHADAVDILLARGADANAADADGITPLQAALAGAHPGIAAALQRAGAR